LRKDLSFFRCGSRPRPISDFRRVARFGHEAADFRREILLGGVQRFTVAEPMLCSATLKLWLVCCWAATASPALSNGAIWGSSGLLLASFCEELFAGARGRGGVAARDYQS